MTRDELLVLLRDYEVRAELVGILREALAEDEPEPEPEPEERRQPRTL